MSYWVELRCDFRNQEHCLSSLNTGPMILVKQLKDAENHLRIEAREYGWTFGNFKACCPRCIRN